MSTGINIVIGADASKAQAGITLLTKDITNLKTKLGSLKLEGAIKGDPFSATKKSFTAMKLALDTVFNRWRKELDITSRANDSMVERTRVQLKKLADSYNTNAKKISIVQAKLRKASQVSFGATAEGKIPFMQATKEQIRDQGLAEVNRGTRKDMMGPVGVATIKDTLKEYKKLFPQLATTFNEFMKKMKSSATTNKSHLVKELVAVRDSISKEMKKSKATIKAEATEMARLLQKAYKIQASGQFRSNLKEAGSDEAAIGRKTKRLQELALAYRKAATEEKLGINVAQNRVAQMNALAEKSRLGAKLTKNQTVQLKELRIEQQKLAAIPERKSGFMSAQWFKQRLIWFIQLRGAWMLWRGVVESFREAFAFEQGMQNVQAIAQTTTEQFELLRQRALDMGTTTRYSAKEASEAMVVMAQAGLKTDEIFNSIQHTAHLATATLHDLKDTAKLVTTIMRAWNIESSNSQRIVDTLATGINKTKLNMKDLGTAFNYLTGIAPQINLSLEDTVAMLGQLTNRGMKASTAATSLRALFSALLNPTNKFKKEVEQLKLTMEDVNPELYNVETILLKLKTAGWGAAESYRAFRRRAAGGATIAIENAEALADLSANISDTGRASQMAAEQLGTTQSQWKLFKDQTIAIAANINKDLTPSLMQLIIALKGLIQVVGVLKPVLTGLNMIIKGWADTFHILAFGIESLSFQQWAKDMGEAARKVIDLKKNMQSLINTFRTLKDSYAKYQEAVDKGKKKGGGIQVDQQKRALRYAKEMGLIKDEEIKKIIKNNGEEKGRLIVEGKINKAYIDREQKLAIEYLTLKKNLEIAERTQNALAMYGGDEAKNNLEKHKKDLEEVLKAKEALTSGAGVTAGLVIPGFKAGATGALSMMTGWGEARVENARDQFLLSLDAMSDARKIYRREHDKDWALMEQAVLLSLERKISYMQAYKQLVNKTSAQAPTFDFTPKQIEAQLKELNLLSKASGTTSGDKLPPESELQARMKATYKMREAINDRAILNAKTQKTSTEEITNLEIKGLQIQREALVLSKDYTEEISERKAINADIYALDTKILEKKKGDTTELQAIIHAGYKMQEVMNARELSNATYKKASVEAITKLELKSLDIQKQGLQTALDYEFVESKRMSIKADMYALDTKIIEAKRGDLQELQAIVAAEYKMQGAMNARSIAYGNVKRASVRDINELELQGLDIQKQILQTAFEDATTKSEKKSVLADIYELDTQIVLKEKEAAENANMWTKAVAKMRNELKTSETIMKEFTTGAISGFGQDLGGALVGLATGFPEQTAQAKELTLELESLEEQWREAVGEGRIEDAASLNKQMSNLEDNINDLEDPIKNIENAFKDFFKGIIEKAQEAIQELIAMQAVSLLIGNESNTGSGSGGGLLSSLWSGVSSMFVGTGGVIPQVNAFKSFSTGGMTGSPTMAILGDNPSSKELVIPSENISANKVEGYTRDKEEKTPDINIINVLTQDDIVQALSSAKGEKAIINMIGADMNSRGPMWKQIKSN